MRCAVVLFTRDLRVHDNPALAAAVREAECVVPLFVREQPLLARSKRRAELVDAALSDLDHSLRGLGAGLVVRKGDAVAETLRIVRRWKAEAVYTAEDVSARARSRELRLADAVDLRAFPGVTVIPPGFVTPAGKECYRVFTPYHRAWAKAERRTPEPTPRRARLPDGLDPGEPLPGTKGGETGARAQLERWFTRGDRAYDERGDDLGADATSRLSIPLHLGLLSPLEVAVRTRSAELVRQLAWRDFFAQLLAANPASEWRDLHPGRRRWADDPEGLAAWKAGRTGYPLVDAGMRELAETGFMHNRARLAVASFLTKDLAIDWREGARHFQELLLDGDVASNSGNWQWVAGTGADTRPGRIFNPTLQGRRFDPDGDYVRRWIRELAGVAGRAVHEPWKLPAGQTRGYPAPIVGHDEAAARFRAGR